MTINSILTLIALIIGLLIAAICAVLMGWEFGFELIAVCQNVPGGDVCRISL